MSVQLDRSQDSGPEAHSGMGERHTLAQMTEDELVRFVANPQALSRGGFAIQAARSGQTQGLWERLAQAEVNRYLRAETAAKERAIGSALVTGGN
jgi:uncharacterized protein YgbK (DUF1537 family)